MNPTGIETCVKHLFKQLLTVVATEPIFDVVICSDITRFNPGENFTLNIFFVGIGNITADYLLLYVNGDIYVEKMFGAGGEIVVGKQDKGTHVQMMVDFIPKAIEAGSFEYTGTEINPYCAGAKIDGEYIFPFTMILRTRQNVGSGEQRVKAIYMYEGDDGIWRQSSDTFNFHVTTEAEQIEYTFMLNEQQASTINTYFLFIGLILAVLAFISGSNVYLYIRFTKKEKQNIDTDNGKKSEE
jgi:hypothetical protein